MYMYIYIYIYISINQSINTYVCIYIYIYIYVTDYFATCWRIRVHRTGGAKPLQIQRAPDKTTVCVSFRGAKQGFLQKGL